MRNSFGWAYQAILLAVLIFWGLSASSQSWDVYEVLQENGMEHNGSTIEFRGSVYGVPDSVAHMVSTGISDSLRIDTLVESTVINVYKNDSLFKKIEKAGRYQFKVVPGYGYELEFTHPAYVTKKVYIDTFTIPKLGEDIVMTIDMSMFSPVVATELTEPLSVAKYNSQIENMDWDMEQFEKQVAKMLKME